MHSASDFPWPRIMEISYGVLGLSPQAFWDMTPCEWLCALRGFKAWNMAGRMRPVTRGELQELRARFPDVTAPAAG